MRQTARTVLIALVILCLILAVKKRSVHSSAGLYVLLPLAVTQECGERREIVLQILRDKSLKINGETVSNEDLADRLGEIYQVRVERALFVEADPDASFQEVISVINFAKESVPNLYVVLLTPASQTAPCLFIYPSARIPSSESPPAARNAADASRCS
jgi:biopolymer transport protein ExbD